MKRYLSVSKVSLFSCMVGLFLIFSGTTAVHAQSTDVCGKRFQKIAHQHDESRRSSHFLRDLYQNALNNHEPLANEAYDTASNRAIAARVFEKLSANIAATLATLADCESRYELTTTVFPVSAETIAGNTVALVASLTDSPHDMHIIRDAADDLRDNLDLNIEFLAELGFTAEHPMAGSRQDGIRADQLVLSDETALPEAFQLNQNYPNPFNPTTMISYALPEAAPVSIQVFDLQGRLVKTLQNGFQEAGHYDVSFDAEGLGAGVYLYTIEAGAFKASRQMTLLK